MSQPSFAAVARALTETARVLTTHPRLTLDQAVRQVVWGTPAAEVPYHQTASGDLYDEVHSLIEAYDATDQGYEPGNGTDGIERDGVIAACRAEAARLASYR